MLKIQFGGATYLGAGGEPVNVQVGWRRRWRGGGLQGAEGLEGAEESAAAAEVGNEPDTVPARRY